MFIADREGIFFVSLGDIVNSILPTNFLYVQKYLHDTIERIDIHL